MAENRTARDAEARVHEMHVENWAPPQTLPDPLPQAGYAFRWIRTSTVGQADATNVASKFREGWVPCKAEDHPELQLMSDPNSRFKGNIEVGGLLLCKCPSRLMDQRRAFYSQQNQNQMEAVDNSFMKTNDSRMPLFAERRSETKFGKGSSR